MHPSPDGHGQARPWSWALGAAHICGGPNGPSRGAGVQGAGPGEHVRRAAGSALRHGVQGELQLEASALGSTPVKSQRQAVTADTVSGRRSKSAPHPHNSSAK